MEAVSIFNTKMHHAMPCGPNTVRSHQIKKDKMGCTACMNKTINEYNMITHLKDQDKHGRIVLKHILEKQDVKIWTVFNWFII
jgi:hypothetical protein